jgi:hypothetical protein
MKSKIQKKHSCSCHLFKKFTINNIKKYKSCYILQIKPIFFSKFKCVFYVNYSPHLRKITPTRVSFRKKHLLFKNITNGPFEVSVNTFLNFYTIAGGPGASC